MNENDMILTRISLKFVPGRPIDNKLALFGAKPLPEPMLTQFIDGIYAALGRWVNAAIVIIPDSIWWIAYALITYVANARDK